MVMNFKQYNGKNSCSTCLESGDNTVTPNPRVRYWPFQSACSLRTKEGVFRAVREAASTGEAVEGYKGVPILCLHSPFNPVTGVVTDYLHCVLLGVTKMLLNYWFDKTNRREAFYIGHKLAICNQRLCALTVPDYIKRRPRSIDDSKHWKGTEYQGWLLWFSIPILKDVLPDRYYSHYFQLVSAIAQLLNPVPKNKLTSIEALLLSFYKDLPALYGTISTKMNVHLLRHLHYHVENWGPLWAFSCFPFKSYNGTIKKFFHGTQNMTEQMTFSFMLSQCLPLLMNTKQVPHTRVQNYPDGFQGIGAYMSMDVPADSSQWCSFTPTLAHKFFRLRWNTTKFNSRQYVRQRKTNNYTVCFRKASEDVYGTINYFIELRCSSDVCILVCILLVEPVEHLGITMPHLFKAQVASSVSFAI